MLKLWKYAKCIENYGFNKCQYCFANISATKTQIFTKFYMVVKYYLETLSFKFHDYPCTNARARVVNARTQDKIGARIYNLCARIYAQIFMKFET